MRPRPTNALTTLGNFTPNQVHSGHAATLRAARQTHQATAIASRRDASQAPFTLEELTAQPLPDVYHCPVYSWAGPNAIPPNTRPALRN